MKGVIFNVVEQAITAEHGDAVWDSLLNDAGVDGAYTALGDYPDDELNRLVAAGSRALGVPERELTRRLGQASLLGLGDRYPQFFTPHVRALDFVLTINDVIHPEVRKLHRTAQPPRFDFEVTSEGALVVGYHSARRLCDLAEGMLGGAAVYYGEQATIRHDSCIRRGDDACVLHCRFSASTTRTHGDADDRG